MEDFWIAGSPPPAVWPTALVQTYVEEKVSLLTHKYSNMNTSKGSRLPARMHVRRTQGAYQQVPTCAHTHGRTSRRPNHTPPSPPPRVGWQDPSSSEQLTHSCTCCLPPDCCASALYREHTHTHTRTHTHTHIGFHTGEVAECRAVIISLPGTVVLLTSDKCNSNLASLFSPMNKTYFSWERVSKGLTGN